MNGPWSWDDSWAIRLLHINRKKNKSHTYLNVRPHSGTLHINQSISSGIRLENMCLVSLLLSTFWRNHLSDLHDIQCSASAQIHQYTFHLASARQSPVATNQLHLACLLILLTVIDILRGLSKPNNHGSANTIHHGVLLADPGSTPKIPPHRYCVSGRHVQRC